MEDAKCSRKLEGKKVTAHHPQRGGAEEQERSIVYNIINLPLRGFLHSGQTPSPRYRQPTQRARGRGGEGGDWRSSKRGDPQREGARNKCGYYRSNWKKGPRHRGRKRGRRRRRPP